MFRSVCLLVLCLVALLPLSAFSMGIPFPSSDPQEIAAPFPGDDLLISRAYDRQSFPAVAYNGDDDEWLVVWQDMRSGTWDILGQRVDNSGRILGDILVIGTSDQDLSSPAVAFDSTQERYLVVWQKEGVTSAVQGRVLAVDGSFYTANAFDITSGSNAFGSPDVAYNPQTDEYLVVWEYQQATGNHDIWGRMVSVEGVVDPGGAYALSALAGDERSPSLVAYPGASASAGAYLLAWSNNSSGTFNITGQRLLSDGTLSGVPFGISVGTGDGSGDELHPDVCLDPVSDLAFIVWEYRIEGSGQDIYGRLVDITKTGTDVRGAWLVVSDSADVEQYPAVANNGVGEYLVVWDNDGDLFGRRVRWDAVVNGTTFTVSQAAGTQHNGDVIFGSTGYLAVWSDRRAGYGDIRGQYLSVTGAAVGQDVGLSVELGTRTSQALVYGPAQSEWLVVWVSPESDLCHLCGQRVGKDGQLTGDPLVIAGASETVRSLGLAYNSIDDEFLVVWEQQDPNSDIVGRRLAAGSGNEVGDLIVITDDPDEQVNPAVNFNKTAGQFLVAWEDSRDDPGDGLDWNVYGRRLSRDGATYDAAEFVLCSREGSQRNPEVVVNPEHGTSGQYLVVWEDESLLGWGIAGQRVTGSDPRLDGTNFDIAVDPNMQVSPSAAYGSVAGRYLVTWLDNRLDPAQVDKLAVYGRLVSASGALLGSEDIAVSTGTFEHWDLETSYLDVKDRFFVYWTDHRDSMAQGTEIYGQTLSSDGALLFANANTNDLVWSYAGDQSHPKSAVSSESSLSLVIWHDARSGGTQDVPQIYGRLWTLEEMRNAIFLPMIFK